MTGFLRSLTRIACLAVLVLSCGATAHAQVVINELHYHPSDSAVNIGAGEDAEDLQFVELHNSGVSTVDLSIWSLDGVGFTFPPGTSLGAGEFLVVARNAAFLQANGPAIPGGAQLFEWSTGNLDNDGETVRLVDDFLTVVDEVVYLDNAPWPATADGGGPSLELLHPSFDNAFASVWRASAGTNGTPGDQNSVYNTAPVVLSESPPRLSVVASLPTVSVTFSEPVQFVAAADLTVNTSPATTLVCGSCVAGVGAGPYEFSGFTAPLTSPVQIDLAVGSIQDTSTNAFGGDSWIYSLDVPDVVINELHYHPATPDGNAEFIELHNAEAGAVDISGWALSEFAGTPFLFPASTSIPAGGYVVVTKDTVLLQALTTVSTPHQWPDGSLSNGGETVRLTDELGIEVDRVDYMDDPPWATEPDGGGPSLELIHPAIDNALARAWKASAGTHGTPDAQNSVFSEAPVVLSETPARGSVIAGLTQVSVTFHEPVTGVTAADLTVDAVAASGVTGSGAGPYDFTVAPPGAGVVSVVLAAGAIQDLDTNPFAGDSWQYQFSLPEVVINEIHYHPADTAVLPGENAEDLQFVELYNNDAATVELSGWSITDGIEFDFPDGTTLLSGEFLVVAQNGAFLQSTVTTIPGGTQLFDWDLGSLDNAGERLRIVDAAGNTIDDMTYGDSGSWARSPDGTGPSLELINPALSNEFGASWRGSAADNGTPGESNSSYEVNPAPIVFDVLHSPAIPRPSSPLTVTAHVLDDSPLPPTVTLFFRQDALTPIFYSSTTMLDNGLNGDGAAGDGIFGAVIAGLTNGNRVDFAIRAGDGESLSISPPGHDCDPGTGCSGVSPAQTHLCKFTNAALPTDYPTYHLITTLDTWQQQQTHDKTEYDATLIRCDATGLDCEIYYNVIERYRGTTSLNQHPHSFRIEFSEDQPLASELGFDLTRLNLMSQQGARQQLGNQMFEAIGDRMPMRQFVRLNTDPLSHGGTQEFLYLNIERVDDDFHSSQGGQVTPSRFPDRCTVSGDVCTGASDCPGGEFCIATAGGNAYRGRPTNARLNFEGFDPDAYRTDASGANGYEKITNEELDVWTDLINLTDALNCSTADGGLLCVENTLDGAYPGLVREHVDVDQWARWFAMHMVLVNTEGGIYRDTGDDYFLYMWPTEKHASFMAWDLDAILGATQESVWRTTVASIVDFLQHNEFAGTFVGAVCDQLDGVFSQAQMDARIDALPDELFPTGVPQGNGPQTKQTMKDWVAARHVAVNAEISRQTTLTGLPASPYTDADPVISLSGSLNQCHAASVVVNGQPATYTIANPLGVGASWSSDLTLVSGWNNIVVQTLDHDGVEIDRAEGMVLYAPNCDENSDCDNGDFCDGVETCNLGSSMCELASPVDCDDSIGCNVDTCNETTDACESTLCPMTVGAAGSRYLSITPPAGLASVALRVDSAGLACLPRYVDATGQLTDTPVFQSSAGWGTVLVGDREVVPATPYDVQAEVVQGTAIGTGSTTTWDWGQADNLDDVNLFDILCVLDGFGGIFANCTLHGDDLMGFTPDGLIDMSDVTGVLDAFQSVPYGDGTPCALAPLALSDPAVGSAVDDAVQGYSGESSAAGFDSERRRRSMVNGTTAQMSCQLSSSVGVPGEVVDVDLFLGNPGGLPDVRGYQTQIGITQTSGSGALSVSCPAGVTIDDLRPDYLFNGEANDFPVTNCALLRASSSLLLGGVAAGATEYLSSHALEISAGTSVGSTFEIAFDGSPDSALADASAAPIPLQLSPPCLLTVVECTTDTQCDDANICTIDSCPSNACVYSPSGVCGVSGAVRYYRDSGGGGFEPSTKPVRNVDIDTGQDSVADGTTDSAGDYSVGNLAGTVHVETLEKFGVGGAADANGVGGLDATLVSWHWTTQFTLSENQQIAGDVSGNGSLTPFDSALIGQFFVDLFDHFPIALSTGSDWAFLRCDNYVSESNHDCETPVFVHDPISASEVDDFYGILYGEVTGNWSAPLSETSTSTEEALEAARDRERAGELRERLESGELSATGSRLVPSVSDEAGIRLTGWRPLLGQGSRRFELDLVVEEGEGILAFGFELHFDPERVRIIDVRTTELTEDFTLVTNDLGGDYRIGMYDVLTLEDSGPLLVITVEAGPGFGRRDLFEIRALGNEEEIPVHIERPNRQRWGHHRQE